MLYDKIIHQGETRKVYGIRYRNEEYFVEYLEGTFKISVIKFESVEDMLEWMKIYFTKEEK